MSALTRRMERRIAEIDKEMQENPLFAERQDLLVTLDKIQKFEEPLQEEKTNGQIKKVSRLMNGTANPPLMPILRKLLLTYPKGLNLDVAAETLIQKNKLDLGQYPKRTIAVVFATMCKYKYAKKKAPGVFVPTAKTAIKGES